MFSFRSLSINILRLTCKSVPRRITCRKYVGSSIVAVVAHCSAKDEIQDKHVIQFRNNELSHEQLIHQACSVSVNAASQLLTQTIIAIVEASAKYRTVLTELLGLLEESGVMPNNELLQAELTDLIVECRNRINQEKHGLNELFALMEYVEKVAVATSEASFVAGAESACEILSERIHSAQILIENEKKTIKILENEVLKLQKEVILVTKTKDKTKKEETETKKEETGPT